MAWREDDSIEHGIYVGECRIIRNSKPELSKFSIWILYVVCAELMIRILPGVILILLNSIMIRDFNAALERRKRLQASKFLQSTSRLSLVESENSDGNKNLAELNEEKPSVQNVFGIMRWRPFQPNEDEGKNGGLTTTTESMVQIWRMKAKTSARDQNIIKLLFNLSLIFVLTEIPMAICRILQAISPRSSVDDTAVVMEIYIVFCNVLEIIFASSNFYLYVFCNKEIRNKVLTYLPLKRARELKESIFTINTDSSSWNTKESLSFPRFFKTSWNPGDQT
ncbi:uncharacterized protein LOC111708772 [Eurytemora carolleeae]|uniref:uncharacterized protein LOC111708772 n=1 Tax=Eurytemora carolleeae TaxID=1294199 RepID=UPI000C77EB12|nr:uncharacterized protein LOC111708772 [Eurytemora carolleeae]|eukprot:XP_023338010.1 uncharacterized protein LOC111708772 [Eurytemora affinis]